MEKEGRKARRRNDHLSLTRAEQKPSATGSPKREGRKQEKGVRKVSPVTVWKKKGVL